MRKRQIRKQMAPRGRRAARAVALAVALAWVPRAALGGTPYERSFTFQAEQLSIADLIGEVQVRGHQGSDFRVTVSVRGADARDGLLLFEQHDGPHAELLVQFPTDEHRKYVYPRLGAGSRSSFDLHAAGDRESDWLDKLLDLASGKRIEVRGRNFGDALEVWADVLVEVPAGCSTKVRLGLGSIEAKDVRGPLDLDTHTGPVHAENVRGDLRVDTGSGEVGVRGVEGDLSVDTGSGSVEVAGVRQARAVRLDTGSGSVRADSVRADKLGIDTGSGQVEVGDIEVEHLAVDTGSGSVRGERVAADGVVVDTGSGGVDLELVRMGRGRFEVDTGSGSIRLDLPAAISADFDVEAGSGGIDADIEGVRLGRDQRREARFTVGDGEARVKLSTGSGSIRLRQARAESSGR